MRILLTGSSGRVGRNLLLDGLADRHQVTAFDWTPPPTRLDKVRYAAGSILDRKDLSDEPFAKFGVGHEMGAECSCKITPWKGICTWLAMGFPLGARASRPHTCQGAAPASVGG